MNLLLQTIMNSVMQIFVFTIIPLIWWLATARKKSTFFQWIGLKLIQNSKQKHIVLWTAISIVSFLLLSVGILILTKDMEVAASIFDGLGIMALPSILVYAVFNTSLPEEIVFRGFLLKRLSSKFGFAAGNITQSLLFGLLHGAMFFSFLGPVKAVFIIAFTGCIAWCIGYINEKKADGSILTGWCIHAAANIFSGVWAAFSIL